MVAEKSRLSRLLMATIASIIDRNSAIYVAGPLATGLEYYRRLACGDDISMIRTLNNEKMQQIVASLRRSQNLPVIDPSLISINDWSPTEIGNLYIEIIRDFVSEVRFMPGWQFSSGATKEFAASLKLGKKCLDLDGRSISQKKAVAEVEMAAVQLDQMGIKQHKLHERSKLIRDT